MTLSIEICPLKNIDMTLSKYWSDDVHTILYKQTEDYIRLPFGKWWLRNPQWLSLWGWVDIGRGVGDYTVSRLIKQSILTRRVSSQLNAGILEKCIGLTITEGLI